MYNTDSVTIAWAAGIFEGEGTIVLVGHRATVCVQMTDLDILEKLRDNFGGKIYVQKKQKIHHKESWKWCITKSSDAVGFLRLIYDHLGERRQKKSDEAFVAYSGHRSQKRSAKIIQIEKIRSDAPELTHQQIADIVGVDRTYVSHVIRGKYSNS